MAQSNDDLRQRIEKEIEHHRTMLGALNKLLSGSSDVKSPVAAPRSAAASGETSIAMTTLPAAAPSAAPTGAKRGRPRGRKRRPAGWLMDQTWSVLQRHPASTVSDMAAVIFAESGQSVNNSLLSTLLATGAEEGRFTRDNSGGPRKTRWSLADGAAKPSADAEVPVKRKPGRPKKNP